MASFVSLRCSSTICKLPTNSSPSLSLNHGAFSISFPLNLKRITRLSIQSSSASVSATPVEGLAPAISLTDNALKHLKRIRADRNEDVCLRVGVKQGGCSGMSYTMDFESKENMKPEDSVMELNGFTIVSDPKSLLFLYGMQLDYSDALIGGGFSFNNPNASKTCSCGKSFAT
ncbi:iron-sulfur assembly protein IscA, chloroplastic isoform X1 [Beta vulgaris subsp. vulgaris]|uniref:iron-sulfur assembly protein IscA, chloroplastic isoform X1 n=1 Tax=Beta vulgaris subsp. vulgaris TaxID=3555 RepID=UPI002036682D|nr:iron-sulfur assembly protein IscA, chloroplastic isoform X1 [Beta vulgaris subsp. vulgaris]